MSTVPHRAQVRKASSPGGAAGRWWACGGPQVTGGGWLSQEGGLREPEDRPSHARSSSVCHAELPPPAHSAHRGPGIGPPHPVQKSELSKPLSAIKSPQVLQCDNEKLIGSLLKAKVNFYFLLFKRQRWAGGGGREGERERDPSPIH